MEMMILGLKEFKTKKDKECYMVNCGMERENVLGMDIASYFTTKEHYDKFAPLVGKKVDTKKEVAVFYDKNAIYVRKH